MKLKNDKDHYVVIVSVLLLLPLLHSQHFYLQHPHSTFRLAPECQAHETVDKIMILAVSNFTFLGMRWQNQRI
jgi:hypothetical protein